MSEQETAPGLGAALRASLRETTGSLGSVFANPNLRKVQLALAGSMLGDWAYSTAVAVWAYGEGGARAVGIWGAVRLALLAVSSPVGATIADRFPRRAVMVGTDVVRVVLVLAAAFCLVLDLHAATVYVLATLASVAGSPFRPAQRSLMPSLARTPAELTASNGTSSTMESLAFFAGPALGAFLIAVTNIPTVFFLNAATFVLSLLLVLAIKVPAAAPVAEPVAPEPQPEPQPEPEPEPQPEPVRRPGFLTETLAGFRTIWQDKNLFVAVAEVAAQTLVAGATVVFLVVMAVEILGTGAKGVGYLDSAFGVGAIVGGFVAIARARQHRLAHDMTVGVLLWSVPLLLIVVWPSPVAAFAMVVVLGFGNPLVDVNLDTIIQRLVPDEVMGRVFGAMEASAIATMSLGAFVMPFLIEWLGLGGGLAALGVVVAALALAGLPRMRSLDRLLQPPAGLDLLRGLAMFEPLPSPTVETLARRLVPVEAAPGEVVVRQGAESDRFFVIESGRVRVTQGEAVLRLEGRGDFFGEIGLLRDVPRTATVMATEHTRLYALGRDDFLSAVTGHSEARSTAEDVVRSRLTV